MQFSFWQRRRKCGASNFSTGPRRRQRAGPRHHRLGLRLEILEGRFLPATVVWINSAGGDWEGPLNWSTGKVPGPGDDAVIDVPGITVTHGAAVDDQVNSLMCKDTFTFTNGSLTMAADSAINMLNVSGGTLGGPGNLTVSGALNLSGGLIDSLL